MRGYRSGFQGRLSMLLGATRRAVKLGLRDWHETTVEKLPPAERRQWGRWSKSVETRVKEFGRPTSAEARVRAGADPRYQRLRKLVALRPGRCYVLGESTAPGFRLTLPSLGRVTAAFTWSPPRGAKAREAYRLDMVQQAGERVIGGSSYFFAMV
jgi:hypothetical protein